MCCPVWLEGPVKITTAPTLKFQIHLPSGASPGFCLFVCGPYWTPTPGTCTGPAFSHIDLPGVQPALPICNHLSLQVCDPGSETKSRRKVVGTREGLGVLQAEPRLREN